MLKTAKLRVEQLENRLVPSTIVSKNAYDGFSNGAVAQSFTDFPTYSSTQFQKFKTNGAGGWSLTTLVTPGVEQGTASANNFVFAQITYGLPGSGNFYAAAYTSNGSEHADGSLHFNFGGQYLASGTYYLSVFVNRGFGAGGQWFWDRTSTHPNHQQEYFWNPGGGFGYGTQPVKGSQVFGSAERMAFTLKGDALAHGQQMHVNLSNSGNALSGAAPTHGDLVNGLLKTGNGNQSSAVQHQSHGISLDQAYAMGLMN